MTNIKPSDPNNPVSATPNTAQSKKLLVLVLTALVLFSLSLNILLIYKNQFLIKSISAPDPINRDSGLPSATSPITHLRVNTCSRRECLFVGDESVEGFAWLTGYYKEYQSEDMGNSVSCAGFVVTGGSETLISDFKEGINKGNTLNKMIDGKLTVNIDISPVSLSPNLRNEILSSSEKSQVEIGVIRKSPRGMGASTCINVIEIITVTPQVPTVNQFVD